MSRPTRRQLVQASALATGALATGLATPALGASGPIRIGWLPALTGPSSSTGIAINRGIAFGVAELNAAGGIQGRKVELVVRDTQSDPTKAVNAAAELTRSEKVNVLYGPGNSGEALACTAVIARARTPQLNPCFVDEVIDAEKYPLAFRTAPSNQQVGAAANRFVMDILKIRQIAVIGDTSGYGTSSVKAFAGMLTAAGASVVYEATIDANQPDLLPDMMRMRNAGARAIMPWSVNPGFLSRILNVRAAMGWDVIVAGQPTLGSGQTRALLDRPEELGEGLPDQFPQSLLRRGRSAAGADRRPHRPAAGGKSRNFRHAALVDCRRLRHRCAGRRRSAGGGRSAGEDGGLLEHRGSLRRRLWPLCLGSAAA
ncbi:ABC transporter substrate-binding protein [Dankookia sp. P2]|uniref:ABC transporter substrate-binding protein n=1 Tax=Dankookia sp. P2 TaxID=3423955 RepID=UPI003D66E432